MDPRNPNQQYPTSNNPGQSGNLVYNNQQNDFFQNFVNADDSAFDSPWASQAFSTATPNLDGFDQNGQAWQRNSYQNANLYPDYPVQPRDFDQSYPRNSNALNYSSFEPHSNQAFTNSPFDANLDYGTNVLNARYGFPPQAQYSQSSETISPQALQNYGTVVQKPNPQPRASQTSDPAQLQFAQGQENQQLQPLTHQDWISLTTPNSNSIYRGGLRIKPTDAYSNATSSTRLHGFIFVGNADVALYANKATVPRQKRKRSRNEALQLLQREKGDGPWSRDREPIVKKLKEASIKLAGPKSATAGPTSRTGTTESASSESSDSGSDDESEEYSESDVDVEPEEPSPVPLTRPADPNKAIEYDLIKTVWAKRRSVLSGTVIRTALSECWNIFKTIRDKWKAKSTNLQQAIEKKDTANKTTFERRVVEQRKLLESCIRLTLKHGHPSIVEKLGENPQLLVVLYQFLHDRIRENEYTGSLIASILELIARCNSVDATLLEKTKFDKLLPRLVKRGDEQGKVLSKKILENSTAAKKPKASNSDSVALAPRTSENGIGEKGNGTPEAHQSPSKADSQDTKMQHDTEKKPTKLASGNKPSHTSQSNAEADASKVKVVQTTAKPSSFFAGLQSASKKPGTSTKSKDGKPSTEPVVKSEEAKPPPKPSFSFAATMANLAKQKEAPPVKAEDAPKPESPEEKRKRIRKEQRRGLRVSFKSERELVQIREFVHDPEEELGHEDSQVRDVGDSRGEGQMLKMHKDMDFMDDDEDYEPPEEIEIVPPWTTPANTDFGEMREQERDQNYMSRAGHQNPESDERKIQDQRDSSTLMVVYPTLADIPPSPREPQENEMAERMQEKEFGPPDAWIKEREAECRANRPSFPKSAAAPTADIASLLRMMNGQSQSQQPISASLPQSTAPTAAQTNPASTSLNALFAQLASASSTNGPQQTSQNTRTPQQQPAVAPAFNLQATLASLAQPNQGAQMYAQQQNPGFQVGPSAQQAAGAPDLSAILAQINGQRAPQAPQMPNFAFNSGNVHNENDRKRQFDGNDQDEYGGGKKTRANGPPEKKKYFGVPRLPCRFWQEGKCRKGEDCTFLHE